jgi:thioesterase domain-containing protein/acyl carrier protein
MMQATPATWHLLLEINWPGSPNLKILCGGEAWSSKLAEQLLPRCGSLWNMYGPTETTVWSSVHNIMRGERVLIGPPIANTSFYVLQPDFQLAPPLVPGELHIGGAGVARGYLNRAELTKERFVLNPFSHDAEERLYRTGDIVRYLPNGTIEFIGRTDSQVKIRGFRIELDEIATFLRRHADVQDAAVVVQDGMNAERQLVAYVIASKDRKVDGVELQAFLRRQLPTYMVPSGFEMVERFPLTPAGKIDRKALQKSSARRSGRARLDVPLPRNPIEQVVADVWSGILGIENIGVQDDFFDLGGHSLMIVRMLYQINAALGVKLGVPDLFRNPTVEQLAAVIESRRSKRRRQPAVVQLQEGGNEVPLYFIYAGPDEFRLAQLMGTSRPVYAIEVPLPLKWRQAVESNRRSSFPDMDQFAAPFVNALLAHAGSAPCMLAGHSFAGLVAFETARQFQMQGGNVETVIIVDKWARYPAPVQVAWKNLRQCWTGTPNDPEQSFAKSVRRAALIVWWPLRITASVIFASLWSRLGHLTATFDEEGVPVRWGLLERLYWEIERKYRPQALDCRGIIFRTEFMDLNQSVRVLDESLGWQRLFTRGLVAFPISGDHISIFREQSHSLALIINKVLQRRETVIIEEARELVHGVGE